MSFDIQHGLTQYVARRRAPLDPSVAQAVRDALEEGDWLTVVAASGRYAPVGELVSISLIAGTGALPYRLAWPIACEPQQPDSQAAGLMVIMGDYSAMTDRYAPDPTFTGYGGVTVGDIPDAVRVAPAWAAAVPGTALVAAGFEAAKDGNGITPLIFGLTTALLSLAEDPYAVAYVEREPNLNNSLLQLATF